MKRTDDVGVWSANETVYNAGTVPELNYLVIEGSAQITAPNGYYLGEVGQGELFGEASFILGTKRSTTVVAGSNGLKAKIIPPDLNCLSLIIFNFSNILFIFEGNKA